MHGTLMDERSAVRGLGGFDRRNGARGDVLDQGRGRKRRAKGRKVRCRGGRGGQPLGLQEPGRGFGGEHGAGHHIAGLHGEEFPGLHALGQLAGLLDGGHVVEARLLAILGDARGGAALALEQPVEVRKDVLDLAVLVAVLLLHLVHDGVGQGGHRALHGSLRAGQPGSRRHHQFHGAILAALEREPVLGQTLRHEQGEFRSEHAHVLKQFDQVVMVEAGLVQDQLLDDGQGRVGHAAVEEHGAGAQEHVHGADLQILGNLGRAG